MDFISTSQAACENIPLYSTNFGYRGTYYDYVSEIAEDGADFTQLVDISITDEEIESILTESGFTGYRLTGAAKWIRSCIEILKELSR